MVKIKMVEYLVQSKVRAYIKKKGLNTGGNALEALDKALKKLIDDASARAKANDRKTLMARDC
jgi:histone H3/H4